MRMIKSKCYACNYRLEAGVQEVVSIYQVPKNSSHKSVIESDTVATFCAQCFWDNCDSKLNHFKDRFTTACLYCEQKVDFNHRHFYLSWERSFDVINSQLIHGKCYNENIAIYETKAEKREKNGFWNTTFSNFTFPSFNWPSSTGPKGPTFGMTIDINDILINNPMTDEPNPYPLVVAPSVYKQLVKEIMNRKENDDDDKEKV